ncbi:hypothetical protein DNHGIG_04660 [Collibacillus ludicampi]|uniref:IDEAL domain-containing protein n=1 Tax=Collibacillus ludicampi TaxID=2771369 RepID=A0AAV4LAQ6_9BACL|nr:hypothetical protein [Collibacillus ludicampi]GIM44917.1 hypothetical protein DNHGIG_04660 [Collibacillus ludicampi]
MDNAIVIFRNISGRIALQELLDWKRKVQALGIYVDEKARGKAIILHLHHEDDDLVFYLYEQSGEYQLHIEYMRVKIGDGRMLKALESMIESLKLHAEKYYTGRSVLYRTLYVNGIIMDEGVFVERKIPPDWDLRIMREALMGHIYIALEQYMDAKKKGDTQLVQELHQRLCTFVEEVAQVDQVLNSDRFNS